MAAPSADRSSSRWNSGSSSGSAGRALSIPAKISSLVSERAKSTLVSGRDSSWGRVLRDSIRGWARSWGMPRLAEDLSLRSSSRLRRSLGTYRSDRSEITLAAWLLDGPSELLDEVLCHEAAHAAVHLAHGQDVRPHGREWQGLMVKVGMRPRIQIPVSELPASRQSSSVGADVWEHRCPVCQATRLARTRVSRWRCRRCRDEGRSGELVIEKVPRPISVDG